ncbi:MAG: prolyl oligopeptidase family serine peptidase [Gemmatimonadota bacterium]|jgi:prolyl oligopeptidase
MIRHRAAVLIRAALFVSLLATCSRSPYPPPPATRVEPVTDTLHGVAITDPYRWLEDQAAPEVRDWIARQNAYADSIVGQSPLRARLEARLAELMAAPSVGGARRAGDFEYFTVRRRGDEVASIVRRPAPDSIARIDPAGDYETVVDPLALRADGTAGVGIEALSSDGRFMAWSLRDGGHDEVEIRIRDLATMRDLPDTLPLGLYNSIAFDRSGTGLFYGARSRESGERIRWHRLGTPIVEDSTLFGEGYGPTAFISMSEAEGGRYRIFTVQHGWARNEVWLQDVGAGGAIRPIIRDLRAHSDPRFVAGSLWLHTDWQAPRFRIVRVDLAHPEPENWTDVIPESDDVLAGFSLIEDRLYVSYIHDVASRIAVFTRQGEPAGSIDVPPHHSASLRGAGPGSALLSLTSLGQPSITWRIDLETGERELWQRDEIPFDTAAVEVNQVWYISRDGTRAPMYVMHRKGLVLDGSAPALLTGYGGFNVSLMPRFDPRGALQVEEGGVYAVATLRGGGEFGESWHRDGMLENKQHVFDDFTAAAAFLVDSGYTRPQRLAIRGASNGGLLMGAAITQRPDLFRAAYVGVPDLDMVRFYTFTSNNNMPALLEYGDASIPEQFEAIRLYSPYQNVRDGTRYPAVMVQTGDLDTRVPPLQGRKFAARLQAATASGLPVILHYDERMGHAGGRAHSTVVRDAAMEMTFLLRMTGVGGGR